MIGTTISKRVHGVPGALGIGLALALTLVGCTSTDVKSNLVGEYNLIPKIAGKDFVVLGLVSVNAEETTSVSPLHLVTTKKGEAVTFDLLLQKAKELYPDVSDIINVRIDQVDQSKTGLLDFLTGSKKTVKYVGNALAVKYTDALQEVQDPLAGKGSALPGGSSTGEKKGLFGLF